MLNFNNKICKAYTILTKYLTNLPKSHEGPASVSCEGGICVPEEQEQWMYGNCVQFLKLICATSSPRNAYTCQMSSTYVKK
jgi:hypothetical protein